MVKAMSKETFMIYGRRPIIEALARQVPIKRLFLQQGARGEDLVRIEKEAMAKGIPYTWVDKKALFELVGDELHQGVVAETPPYMYADAGLLLQQAAQQPATTILLLDELTDPHNIGAIVRTAASLDVFAVFLPKHRSASVTPAVVKASSGAVFHMPIAQVTNLVQLTEQLKDIGFWVYGAAGEGGDDFRSVDYRARTALVIGSEGKGIRAGLRKHLDALLAIPMNGGVGSLNASVAAALFMFEAYRARHPIGR